MCSETLTGMHPDLFEPDFGEAQVSDGMSEWVSSVGHNGGYIGSPELGLLNVLQAREQVPNAPLCSDPVALDRLWNETVKCIDDAAGENWAKDGPQAPPATKDTPVAGVPPKSNS